MINGPVMVSTRRDPAAGTVLFFSATEKIVSLAEDDENESVDSARLLYCKAD